MGLLSSKPDLTVPDLFWHVEFAKVMNFHQFLPFWQFTFSTPEMRGALKPEVFHSHAIIDELFE
jgi:hypothetical protein